MDYSEIDNYIKKNLIELKNLSVEICKIPSMTGSENEKAQYIKEKVNQFTGETANIDEAGNVIYIQNVQDSERGQGIERGLLLDAHIDTVFKDLYDINVIEKERRLYAPSIMDNSINAAALLFIIKMLKELDIILNKDIIFAFTVGEEGKGNLKGIKHIVSNMEHKFDEVVAVDCNLDTVINKAVGSKRYSVSLKTQGGHSWFDFGNKSAVLYAAKLIGELYNIKVPEDPKTTYNAGIVNGGTSVNTIAEDAEVLIDLRSEDEKSLEKLNNDFLKIIEELNCSDVIIKLEPIGDRPCGCIDENSRLFKSVIETRKEIGLDIKFASASTNANMPLSVGIPAVTFGVCTGGGTHTLNEYLDIDSLETGIKNLIYLIKRLAS